MFGLDRKNERGDVVWVGVQGLLIWLCLGVAIYQILFFFPFWANLGRGLFLKFGFFTYIFFPLSSPPSSHQEEHGTALFCSFFSYLFSDAWGWFLCSAGCLGLWLSWFYVFSFNYPLTCCTVVLVLALVTGVIASYFSPFFFEPSSCVVLAYVCVKNQKPSIIDVTELSYPTWYN